MTDATVDQDKRRLPNQCWRTVVSAGRLWAKGDGWWGIALDCGHEYAVLHGQVSPLGEQCKCNQCRAADQKRRP